MSNPLQARRYMAGLDGIRALAVLAVIAYHLNLGWAPGGLLGVGVFFVLSGYLITDQLISGWQQNRRIDLKDFWIRRFRRLLPAMLVMLIGVGGWLLLFDPERLITIRGDMLSSLLYVNNWWLIFHEVSYFESFGPPSPLGHLWSLAVEEQFYLVAPLLLLVALRRSPRRGILLLQVLLLALVSIAAMAVLYVPGVDPSRVYYGTDTRIFGLLIGSALALIWPSSRMSESLPTIPYQLLETVGAVGMAIIVIMVWQTSEYGDFLFRGGMVLLSVASAMLIAAAAHPATILGRVLGAGPLKWLGVRSYGIYLWHYPIIVLTSPAYSSEGTDYSLAALQIGATLVLAALSYRYIEEPIRRGGLFRKPAAQAPQGSTAFRPVLRSATLLGTLTLLVVLTVSCIGSEPSSYYAAVAPVFSGTGAALAGHPGDTSTSKPDKDGGNAGKDAQHTNAGTQMPAGTGIASVMAAGIVQRVGNQTEGTQWRPAFNAGLQQGSRPQAPGAKPSLPDPPTDLAGDQVTAVGDSIMLNISSVLEKQLPGVTVDGKIGRQMKDAGELLEQLKSQRKLKEKVVIQLGTNGPFSEKKLSDLIDSLPDAKQIVLVTVRVPRKWQDEVNETISQVAAGYSKVTIADWYTASQDHEEYFEKDGVHLKPTGAKAYAELLLGALEGTADARE